MIKLRTLFQVACLSETTRIFLVVNNKDRDAEYYGIADDVGVHMTEDDTNEHTGLFLTPFILKYGHTDMTERLLNMRVKYTYVDSSGFLNISLTK